MDGRRLHGSHAGTHHARCLQEKRCMSMPSVSVSSPPTVRTSHRPRLLRLQDRRFHHRFHNVPPEEKLVNYFSCALVSDILLQGHLFVTRNYFAFYSNIFGHKTEILVAVADVVKVTKEKTARIIPNAVGVYTETDKYVFGSMLSRDSAYRVIQQTWIQTTDAGLGLPDDSESEASPVMLLADEDSSVSSGVSGDLGKDDFTLPAYSDFVPTPEDVSLAELRPASVRTYSKKSLLPPSKRHRLISSGSLDFVKGYIIKVDEVITSLSQLSRTWLLFMMSTVLIVLLFVSTSILLYRIHLVHQRLIVKQDFHTGSSAKLVQAFEFGPDVTKLVRSLEERIRSLAEIRQTLEELVLVADKFEPRPSINTQVT